MRQPLAHEVALGLGRILSGLGCLRFSVEVGQDVLSPPNHKAFNTIPEMVDFIEAIAEETGLPVGIKAAIGKLEQWEELTDIMKNTGKGPDFITVDGGEGGNGAAPTEMTHSVGTPIRDGLIFVNNALIGFGLRKNIRIIGGANSISKRSVTA